MSKRILAAVAAVIAVFALAITPVANAAKGDHGKPGGGEETTANNLSVPAVFIGPAGFGLTNPDLQPPTGTPSTGFGVSGYYYVQGVHTWQAEFAEVESDTATAKWGDNIVGEEASAKAGTPFRVEMGLTSTTETTLQGYSVVKLQPSLLDRESPYGTLATDNGDGTYSATAAVMPASVWGPGATLTITGPTNATADMPGEINATGAIVFGYNWTPQVAGTYTLTFNPPSGVTVADSDSLVAHVTVSSSTGKGGGGGHRPVR